MQPLLFQPPPPQNHMFHFKRPLQSARRPQVGPVGHVWQLQAVQRPGHHFLPGSGSSAGSEIQGGAKEWMGGCLWLSLCGVVCVCVCVSFARWHEDTNRLNCILSRCGWLGRYMCVSRSGAQRMCDFWTTHDYAHLFTRYFFVNISLSFLFGVVVGLAASLWKPCVLLFFHCQRCSLVVYLRAVVAAELPSRSPRLLLLLREAASTDLIVQSKDWCSERIYWGPICEEAYA